MNDIYTGVGTVRGEAAQENGGRKAPEILCIGQAVVDCITKNVRERTDGTGRSVAESITLSVGGDAVNEASALVGMGHSVGIMCCVGDDHAGRVILQEAGKRGIDTSCVTVQPDLSTPVANMFVREDGSRSSISSRATLLPGYVPDLEEALRRFANGGAGPAAGGSQTVGSGQEGSGAGQTADSRQEARGVGPSSPLKVVSFASLFRAPLDDPAVIRRLVRAAHESGAIVCADTKLPTFRRTELSEIADVLPLIDYFFPNEEEAAYYTDMEEPREAITELLSMGIQGVVVKCGAKGICAGLGHENPAVGCGESFCATCLASDCSIRAGEKIRGGEMFSLPAIPVDAVDTTGAGDHFAAGFIHGLLRNMDFRQCCGMGLAAAARRIVRTGG